MGSPIDARKSLIVKKIRQGIVKYIQTDSFRSIKWMRRLGVQFELKHYRRHDAANKSKCMYPGSS